MTTESDASPKNTFVPVIWPWLLALGAFALYLATLNHWIPLGGLAVNNSLVARLEGWDWHPELFSPLTWLFTYPIRWLAPTTRPIALNVFAALCGALTVALL